LLIELDSRVNGVLLTLYPVEFARVPFLFIGCQPLFNRVFVCRELFVSVDATNLSRAFLLRGDYYTLRSSTSWKSLKQSVEWAFFDKKITETDHNGTPGLSPYHTLATLDMTLTLAERLAKDDLEGITDVPAIVDNEPPRLLDNHSEVAPFPVYLTRAAPPMRVD
jgi:hypothetical protein